MKAKEVVDGVEQAADTVNYGKFLQVTFDLMIVAFPIFLYAKGINTLNKKKAEAPVTPAAPPAPSKEELLLTEIRDLLKKK